MRARRLVGAFLIAAALAVPLSLSAFYCFPGCALYTPWDFEYYLFQCWDCPPNPPEG